MAWENENKYVQTSANMPMSAATLMMDVWFNLNRKSKSKPKTFARVDLKKSAPKAPADKNCHLQNDSQRMDQTNIKGKVNTWRYEREMPHGHMEPQANKNDERPRRRIPLGRTTQSFPHYVPLLRYVSFQPD
eukprot:gnl/MRDRNA2_/MRDRNA2_128258_c0_seq1.p1 gnl/MRDRNA2_/MRDRNA2_128258_c0~~gnl/MRDRNA2_/MRDRNA2_128258_c0_seq1.p1  ORF type:complete len:132 (+),score=14.01 gnl/MRDRNA2_/MRDRNA2_128258_c0_seq1:115-510(+)